jgi:Nodulation protein Z (NodZ)
VRVVVSKRVAGLGSCLVALFRAWYYARRTRRHLIVDWRHSLYSPDPACNLFSLLFENRSAIADVPIVCGSAVASFPFPEPFFPLGWNSENIHRYPAGYQPPDALDAAYPTIKSRRRVQYEICTGARDVPEPTVVFHHGLRSPAGGPGECYYPALPPTEVLQTFLDGLTPRVSIASIVDAFAARHFQRRPVVGLQVRHGNGEQDGLAPRRLSRDPMTVLEEYVAALRPFRERVGEPGTLFLCTDSIDVEERFTARLSNVITFPKQLRASGAGPLHLDAGSPDAAVGALADMLLLSRCDALLHTNSQVTFYPLFKARFLWERRVGQKE